MTEHDKLDHARHDADTRRETGAAGSLTRRGFMAKAGLTAAALGAAGTLPALASSCGSSASTSSSSGSSGAASKDATVVRFVFAPDPVWNFMKDTGIVAKYEELYNFKIVNTTTWDETAWFVGGHADIASMGTYEVPSLSENTGKEFVSFGQYNMMRDTVFVRADSPYKNITDLVGKRIAVSGTGSGSLIYPAMFKKLYGVDLRLGGGDFKANVQEQVAMPASMEKGDSEASIGLVEYEIPYLVSGKHRWLFPEAPTGFEYYRDYIDPTHSHMGVMTNLWVTTPAWLNANEKVAQGFNVMWQEGVNAWWANKATIIMAYPDLFTVENDAELQWFLKYEDKHDQTVKTVYMNQAWVDAELAIPKLLMETGYVKQGTPAPQFRIMSSPSDAPSSAQPPQVTAPSTSASPA